MDDKWPVIKSSKRAFWAFLACEVKVSGRQSSTKSWSTLVGCIARWPFLHSFPSLSALTHQETLSAQWVSISKKNSVGTRITRILPQLVELGICFGFNGIIVIVFDIYWGQNKLAILWYVDICGCVWKRFYTLQVVTWFVPKVRKIQLVDGQWLEFQFRSYIEFVAPTKTSANLQPSSIFTWMTYVVVFFFTSTFILGMGQKLSIFVGWTSL